MRHFLTAVVMTISIGPAYANDVIDSIVDGHILPGYTALADTTATLAQVAEQDCAPIAIQPAYHDAFDAWVAVSHLRFGPSEVGDRAFALAFWPDGRGATPKTLRALIADEDPIANSAAQYAHMSIAARGFYAMEFLLFDLELRNEGPDAYRCQLIATAAQDIALVSAAILADWDAGFADQIKNPSADGLYRTDAEVLQEFYKSLTTGLQFASETRLGRPLGTFDKPRPMRAEAWRSGRSAQHVTISLTSLRDLAERLSARDAVLLAAFDTAIQRSDALDDPIFAGVADPATRIRVEVLQQAIEGIRTVAAQDLGPRLGVSAGFNALDGD